MFFKSNQYLGPIDGLRALAVIAVIVFHANQSWLPAGYLGVDIFFAISGFLISRIVLTDLQKDRFNYARFYASRFRRILPALFFMIFITTLVAALISLPVELKREAGGALTNMIFSSNFYYSNTADYFNGGVVGKPLIHTWSLAVEMQFYFIWPALLAYMYKRKQGHIKSICNSILCLIFLSVLLSQILIYFGKFNLNYYSTFTRSAELLSGSYIGIISLNNKSRVSSVWFKAFGLFMIVASLLLIRSETLVPGLITVPLLLGTMAILIGAKDEDFISKLLSAKPLSYIGKLSYSLYLWHWPIFAFYMYINAQELLSINELMILSVPMLAAAWLSFHFIETACRKKQWSFRKTFIRYYLLPVMITATVIIPIKVVKGKLWMYGIGKQFIEVNFTDPDTYCYNRIHPSCLAGDKTSNDRFSVLYGDSHASHYIPFFDKVAQEQDFAIEMLAADSCIPALNKNILQDDRCKVILKKIQDNLPSYKTIYIAAYWQRYIEASPLFLQRLRQTMIDLHRNGARIKLLQDVPSWNENAVETAIRLKYFYARFNVENLLPSNDSFIAAAGGTTANRGT